MKVSFYTSFDNDCNSFANLLDQNIKFFQDLLL